MAQISDEEALLQNLKDAGCDRETIDQFFGRCGETTFYERQKILKAHRRRLLEELHSVQKRIDCLDYLFFEMDLQQKKGKE